PRDFHGVPAERLPECVHVGERDARLLGVEVDPDAAHRDDVEHLRHAGVNSLHILRNISVTSGSSTPSAAAVREASRLVSYGIAMGTEPAADGTLSASCGGSTPTSRRPVSSSKISAARVASVRRSM